MKKIYLIIIIIILIFFKVYYNDSFSEEVKKIIGIDTLVGIEIIEEGDTQEPSSHYIIFKVANKEELVPILQDYQKAFPKKEKINIKLSKYLNHFDLEKSYYVKVFEHRKQFREALIQNDIIIYVLTYSN